MYISCLLIALLLSISAGVQGSRSKRILPINENCDPQNEVCMKGDWIDKDIADCRYNGKWYRTCEARNSVFYSWIVDVEEKDRCEPVRESGFWWSKKKKRFLCGDPGTDTRCVCSDYKFFLDECRCQYWPEEDPASTQPAFCTAYYTGGSSYVHHWVCCNNCNDDIPSQDGDNSTDVTCDGITWHGGSYASYCGSCGKNTGGGRPKHYFNCESCSQQQECADYCSGPIRNLPGFCWLWADCFKSCCLARSEQNPEDAIETMSFCGDGTCDSDETYMNCPSDCCYKINSRDCGASNPDRFNEQYECCGDTSCCIKE